MKDTQRFTFPWPKNPALGTVQKHFGKPKLSGVRCPEPFFPRTITRMIMTRWQRIFRSANTNVRAVMRSYYSAAECDLHEFSQLLRVSSGDPAELRFASEVVHGGIGIYDAKELSDSNGNGRHIELELARLMLEGSGIAVFRRAFEPALVESVTRAFNALIVGASAPARDHFAKPGANDRVWNALEKLAVSDPALFVQYYSNDTIAMVSRAWLGPNYQITSQLNVVKPGGDAQEPHRDYHLGFATDALASLFPAHVHLITPMLTLQGAVAHSDMPVRSGPTTYLPHSHKYKPGYVAFRRDDFKQFYEEHKVTAPPTNTAQLSTLVPSTQGCNDPFGRTCRIRAAAARMQRTYIIPACTMPCAQVQLELRKGDAVFFNPAVFHAAGRNTSKDIQRMANLLQVPCDFISGCSFSAYVQVGRCIASVNCTTGCGRCPLRSADQWRPSTAHESP